MVPRLAFLLSVVCGGVGLSAQEKASKKPRKPNAMSLYDRAWNELLPALGMDRDDFIGFYAGTPTWVIEFREAEIGEAVEKSVASRELFAQAAHGLIEFLDVKLERTHLLTQP